jgi:quercetin dioxygenase-like cupin family protein
MFTIAKTFAPRRGTLDTFLELENRHNGEILRMRRVHDAHGRIVLMMDGSLPPGTSGPPLHVHFHEVEEFTVKAGILGARVGGKKIEVSTGGTAVFPVGVVHSWWNAGKDVLEVSGQVTPVVDLDRYLQAAWAVLNASKSGRPSLFFAAHVLWRHRHTQAIAMPPRAIQRIILPVVLVIGHILGKYRGDGWPGSSASCHGAPEVAAANAHPQR